MLRLKDPSDRTIETYLSSYNTFIRFAGKRGLSVLCPLDPNIIKTKAWESWLIECR